MFFTAALYLSLCLCLLGIILKVRNWLTIRIGEDAAAFSGCERVRAASKALAASLSGPGLPILFKAFIRDVILQLPLLKDNRLRWLMHMAVYWGFILLLLMHALDGLLTRNLFPEYASTLNPFIFLRNLFGALVVLGMVVAVYRRIRLKGYRLPSGVRDMVAILLIALIMVSGFALEALKISSPSGFGQMVEEYASLKGEEELQPLKQYWRARFGVVFPEVQETAPRDMIEKGRDVHEENCAACHSRPAWAFVSYSLSRIIKPAVRSLERSRALNGLWIIHFLSCFIGLALLPFTKFFHIFSSPLHLMIRAVRKGDVSYPANAITLRAMALDACTHCGTCSRHCSVAPVFQRLMNRNILPSEKLLSIKVLAKKSVLSPDTMHAVQE
ncbi:MAG: nitrate reductase, partial [Pseudomonadota bacterium]